MPDPAARTGARAEPGSSAVFISYRSADGKKDASRLAEDLREIFGAPQVFFDKQALQAGASWREQINQALHRRPVVLLVISEQFFGARDLQGRRIDQPDDPVRMEVLDALRVGARLLPLLCEGVTMPREADLPAELRAVPQAHALKLRTEDWSADLLRLADRLVELGLTPVDDDWRERLAHPAGAPRRRWRLRQTVLWAAIALALAGAGKVMLDQMDERTAAEAAQARRERALALLAAGLEAHRGKDVNLDLARVQYLAALEAQADYGPAHYFLAQVYATQSLPEDALLHYRAALAHPAGLDKPQLADASLRLAALERSEAEPVALGATGTAGATGGGFGAPQAPATPAPATPAPATPAPATPAPAPATPPGTDRPEPSGAEPAPPAPQRDAAALVGRVGARPDRQQEAQARADALFSDDAATRLNAASLLGVELAAASDVLPLALQRALDALARPTLGDAERAGVIATLRLVGSASPISLQAHREGVEALLRATSGLDATLRLQGGAITASQALARSADRRPVAYIQIAADAQRPLAARLADKLRQAGYEVAGIENVGARAPARTDLRAQGYSNLGLARWMAKAMGDATGAPVAVQVLRRARPAVDTYEIWLGRDLCVAPGPQPAGCTGPPAR